MAGGEAWQDQPEAKTFPVEVTTQSGDVHSLELNIGNCAIALFRRRAYLDHLVVFIDEETIIRTFDQIPMVHWMGGIALNPSDREDIRRAESKLGSFYSRYSWNPDVNVTDYPTPQEVECYLDYVTQDADHPELLLEDPEEEPIDDGA